jgi:phenylpropionate dioxygenase-like ring-hydroxylating dioxygenase large terminal subunit
MTTTIRTTGDLRDDMPKLGLRNFWWPAAQAKKIGTKPVAIKLLGEELAFFRQAGKVYAFHDRCPHRGLPLSCGAVRYPGTLTCAYHGWTYDVSGKLVAALNEGPDSALPGKVQLRTYPVEERAGIVWVFMGTGQPKPLEEDVPAEILASDTIVNTVVDEWPCSWLPTVENLLDTHDIVVHPNSAYFYFRKLPSWQRPGASDSDDGKGVNLRFDKMGPAQDEYPGLGTWPKQVWWRFAGLPSPKPGEYPISQIRVPAIVRVGFADMAFNRWAVPIDETHVRAFMVSSRRATGFDALKWHIKYRLWNQWAFMRLFLWQDRDLFLKQDYFAPEKLSVTDVGVIRWRRLVTAHARAESAPSNGAAHANGSANGHANGPTNGTVSV